MQHISHDGVDLGNGEGLATLTPHSRAWNWAAAQYSLGTGLCLLTCALPQDRHLAHTTGPGEHAPVTWCLNAGDPVTEGSAC